MTQYLLSRGGEVIGTHKRGGEFPFTFGQDSRRRSRALNISTEGARNAFWAAKEIKFNANERGETSTTLQKKRLYALAYRDGLGCVALLQTSDPCYGPLLWTYQTRSRGSHGRNNGRSVSDGEKEIISYQRRNFKVLTESQGTSDWFLMRAFRFTSSTAASILRELYKGKTGNEITNGSEKIIVTRILGIAGRPE